MNKRELRKEIAAMNIETIPQMCGACVEFERALMRYITARESIYHRARAAIRVDMGYVPGKKTKENEAIRKAAEKIFNGIKKGTGVPEGVNVSANTVMLTVDSIEGATLFSDRVEQYKKRLEIVAEMLPVYEEHWLTIKGVGALGLGRIIGEAGDITRFKTVQQLWKRFGLAVFDGVCQGRYVSTKHKGDSTEVKNAQHTRMGYNAKRRSVLWTIGDSMIKAVDGPFRKVYDWRKEIELKKPSTKSPLHAHRKAQRYMEKQLLLELWEAWHDKEANIGFYNNERFRVA
jgi:hypothetical protein